VDPWLLGIFRRRLWMASWLLGPHIGFYGGVNYGFGYGGVGFGGGEWRGGSFYYNRSVTNVTNVTTVYNQTVIVRRITWPSTAARAALRPVPQTKNKSQSTNTTPNRWSRKAGTNTWRARTNRISHPQITDFPRSWQQPSPAYSAGRV
jgi:hypothetical protein